MSSSDRRRRLLQGYILERLAELPSARGVILEPTQGDWFQRGLDIRITSAVINTIIVEAVRRAISSELKHEIRNSAKQMVINMIILPLSIMMILLSIITAIVLFSMGAWITSIPFILSTIFGIYFIKLKNSRER